jgi:hypothetical protein
LFGLIDGSEVHLIDAGSDKVVAVLPLVNSK